MSLLQRLKPSINSENLSSHLSWFSQVRRDTGGTGEQAAVDYIVSKMKEYGVPVTVHEFDSFLSYPRSATLEVLTPEKLRLPCVTHSFSPSTGPQGVSGEMTFFPDSDATKTGGTIALLDGLLAPIKVLEASKAGCQALIFANQDWVIHNMISTTIWGTPTMDQVDRLPSTPVVSINKQSGEKLKELLAKGPVTVRVVTEVETGWYRSKLPEVLIEGTGEKEKFVLVGAHYCSWEVGVTDNATGDACLLEMARVLHQHRSELKRSVRICWWPGHSHGRYSGSTWYADTFFDNLDKNCVTYHNIDSPGVKGATMYIARHTTSEIQAFCQGAIEQLTGQKAAPIHRPSRAADQAFLANGVPAFSTYPFLPEEHEDRRPWTGGCANAWWWHSSEDTLDKADIDILTLDTTISSTAVAALCTADLLPLSPADQAAEIKEFVAGFSGQAEGHLDASVLQSRAGKLAVAAGALTTAARAAKSESELKTANNALMRLSRILGPVIYSKGGRFTHDPADWSPIMRNSKSSSFPGLNKIAVLSGLKGTREYGFLKTQILREMNRVNAAFEEATALCETTVKALAQ
jgi:N-acetylated-alpha-linked acidic dipeptidase